MGPTPLPAAGAANEQGGQQDGETSDEKKEPPKVATDFEGIDQRILALPIPARNILALAAGKANVLFVLEGPAPGETGSTLHKFDLEKRKLDKFIERIAGFEVSANGEKMLYRQGENWNPELRAPLTEPGVNVAAGEYLLAVNGRNLTAADNIYSFFEGTADKQVVLRVGPDPDGSNSRQVTVVPVASEAGLRNLAWVEENRRKVDRMSGGKLAYVHLPNTAQGGFFFFNRYFFPQTDKQGVVVDVRFNSGGQAADYVVDYLRKPLMSYWAVRDWEDFRTPFGTIQGPKAMLINEYAGSGGDLLPYMFRRAGIGPLIGTRTWGGLVGIGGYPRLIDGGSVTAPHFAFYTPEGEWKIENHGVAPDLEVGLDPKAVRQGEDPQLERAVEWLMEELKKNPPPQPQRPPYPNYHNTGSSGP